ncbi:hypothetical protein GF380_00520, partial [Candidatus Uhrbacteria bacterium]|nr:hypothetical protein [Candidatus Uhrbacteria bacterium]MBD3283869.1 hypothetical protein [Candidatus Uhrbacteria bacterium]
DLVASLFMQEIPEIANGIVTIKSIAREPGSRTKVAVTTNDDAIDPIGSCIGQRGTRIQSVIRELGGEKVDVVLWSENVSEYVAAALSPAEVTKVEVNDDEHLASVAVNSDQLSLAIGKGGQNVRLAAKLTNWKITIKEEGGSVIADSESGEYASENNPLDEHGERAERASEADAKEQTAEVESQVEEEKDSDTAAPTETAADEKGVAEEEAKDAEPNEESKETKDGVAP